MKALLLVNAGRPYTDWLPLSKEALQGYNQLIAEVSSQARTQETADKIVTLRTLRGNCLAALVDGLVAKQSQEKDNPYEVDRLRTALKEAADMLQDSIEEFRQLGINNGFFDSYNAALSKVRAALQ